jgi:viroplasmin and RNaseH domain-containing protein
MAKNINLIYCIKKNGHKSYTGDYQKFMRRRQALGEAGLEYGIFRSKEEAMAYLGIAYNSSAHLTLEEKRKNRQEKLVKRQERIKEKIEKNRRHWKFYAVARGYNQKICFSREEALKEVEGYPFPVWHGFDTIEEAAAYVKAFNQKYKGMKKEEVTMLLRNNKLQNLARRRSRMTQQEYEIARESIYSIANGELSSRDTTSVPYRVHLGPKSPEAAERQYRTGTYENYATCRNIKRHKRGS